MRYRIDDVDRSYYRILDVGRGASLDEIRAAHRRLAMVLHPDKQAGQTERERDLAERRMREVNEAWTVLSDSVSRAEYDEALQRAELNAAAERPGRRVSGSGSGGARRNGGDRSLSDNFENADPAFARAFNYGMDEAMLVDADDLVTSEDDGAATDPAARHRRNVWSAIVAGAVVLVAGAFLVVTAYAGKVDGGGPSPGTGEDPLTTIRESVSSTIEPGD